MERIVAIVTSGKKSLIITTSALSSSDRPRLARQIATDLPSMISCETPSMRRGQFRKLNGGRLPTTSDPVSI
jgi:hypothetical protein